MSAGPYLQVWDKRGYMPGTPRIIAQHSYNGECDAAENIRRLGTRDHLCVVRVTAGLNGVEYEEIQTGAR